MNLSYFIWIPLTLIFNFITCFIAVKYSHVSFLKLYFFMVVCSWIPTWSLASYFSKNLIFDGMLYNMIMIVASPLIMMFLGQAANFSTINYIGVFMAIFGLCLIRI